MKLKIEGVQNHIKSHVGIKPIISFIDSKKWMERITNYSCPPDEINQALTELDNNGRTCLRDYYYTIIEDEQ